MDKFQLIEKLKNSKLAVIGAGRSGIAAAKLLNSKGLEVFVSDHGKLSPPAREELERLNIPWEEGMHSSLLDSCQIFIVSPGVNPNHELLGEVKKKDVDIITEIEIGWAWLQGKLVAITGTNGKSTTTALLGEILKSAGLGGEIGGNLAPGKPLSELANQSQPHKWVCAEVSSFQMQLVKYFKPDAVIWTNLSPDHLDRHKDINEYAELKMDLVKRTSDSGFAVLNGDDPIITKLTEKLDKQKLYFGHNDHPQFYAFLDSQGIRFYPDILIPYPDIPLKGEHNLENIMAAGSAALKIGVNPEQLNQGIRNFSGLPHRLEIIGEVEGVTFINNSMCTNEVAFERSLKTYPSSTVIAGGYPKNTDLYHIAEILNSLANQVVLLGKSSLKLAEHLNNLGKTYKIAEDIDKAVYISFHLSKKGGVVILNPGMASFDLFKDFQDRGDKFKLAVSKLRRTVNCA